MSQPPEDLEIQQPDVNSTQQADNSTSQNAVQGNQNRVVQGKDNKAVQGDSNIVSQGNNNTQNIHITNYYYREDIRLAAVQPAEDAASDEKLPCPYRGLYHFSPDDAEYFFGREVFIEELFEVTKTRNFIPVLGASGSGKSSVVLAGLVPKLQQENHWLFTHFRPGSEPFYALAQALVPLYEPDKNATEQMYQARQLAEYLVNGSVPLKDVFTRIERNYANHRVLLIADQFEELYTLCSDEKIRRSFLDTLLAGFQSESNHFSLPPVLVSTMRVDFLGNTLAYPPFADVLKANIKLIRSMNRFELSQVIEKPAQKLGVSFEAGLIKRILNDVESEPGNLPLLEFALSELWEKRTHKQLTHAAYESIGEVQGALSSHADTIYRNLKLVKQQQVCKIFLQLVRPGEGTEDTRRVATKEELGEDNWSLVQYLADKRLVVTSHSADGQETVEFAHEALIRHWHLLQSWIDENRSQIIQKNRIERLAREWQENNRSHDYLMRGKQLNQAQMFQQNISGQLNLSNLASEFIEESIRYVQDIELLEAVKDDQIRRLENMVMTALERPSFYSNIQVEHVSTMTSNPGSFSVGGSVGGNFNNVQGDNNSATQGDNNQGVLGDNNQVTQQNQVGADTGESLTKEDVVKLLAQLETLIQGAELPADTKEEVIEDLSAAKKATDKEEPNKQRALERLGTVAETLDKTSKGVEAGQKIWTTAKPIIFKVATWLGAAAGSHLLGL